MLSTNQKGAIAETAVAAVAVRLGVDVSEQPVIGVNWAADFRLAARLAALKGP